MDNNEQISRERGTDLQGEWQIVTDVAENHEQQHANFQSELLSCSAEKLNSLIDNRIAELNADANQEARIGFGKYGKATPVHKGFIGEGAKVRYDAMSLVDYKMRGNDYFYGFAESLRDGQIDGDAATLNHIVSFMNNYFGKGVGKRQNQEDILLFNALSNTRTDDELFAALEQSSITDLKGKNAAGSTEYAAMAQNLLTFLGYESTFCTGSLEAGKYQREHAFNIVENQLGETLLLDYGRPIEVKNAKGDLVGELPYQRVLSEVPEGPIELSDYNYVIEKGSYTREETGVRKYDIGE